MALDSKAAFQLRASEIGIGSDDITRMEDGGIASFSQFAFCCSYQPGGSSEEALFDHLEELFWEPNPPVLLQQTFEDCFSNAMQWR